MRRARSRRARGLHVADVAGRQHQRIGAADDVGQCVDLGRPAPAEAADGMGRAPSFCAKCGTLRLQVSVVGVGPPRHRARASGSDSFSQSPGVTSGSTRSRPWWTARNRPGNRTSGSRPSAHAGCRRSPAGRLPCALPAGSSTSAARWLLTLRPTIRTAPRAASRDYTHAESGKPLRLNTLIGFRHYAHFSDQLLRPHVLLAS